MMSNFTYREHKLLNRTESLLKHHIAHRKRPCRLKIIALLAAVVFFIIPSTALAVSGEDVVDTAYEYLGYPYGYQCAGPDAFDCGGFVWYVFNQSGVDFQLRINSADLAAQNTAIYDADELEPGDILFFGSSPGAISHWGIYAGDGQVIHSYNEAVGVVLTPLEAVIPSFCYACRIDSLTSEPQLPEYLYQEIGPQQIPQEIFDAIDCQLLPIILAFDHGIQYSDEELEEMFHNISDSLLQPNNMELMEKSGLLATVIKQQQKYDPLRLSERILAIAENPDPQQRHDEYISLIIYSLPLLNIPQTD